MILYVCNFLRFYFRYTLIGQPTFQLAQLKYKSLLGVVVLKHVKDYCAFNTSIDRHVAFCVSHFEDVNLYNDISDKDRMLIIKHTSGRDQSDGEATSLRSNE